MKSKFLIYGILVLAIIGIIVFLSIYLQPTEQPTELPTEPTLLKIEANPAKGFHWAYYLYIPGRVWTGENGQTYLLVEPNNSPEPSDDQSYHDSIARETIEYDGKMVADELKIPMLVPTFPRPYLLQTRALTRDTLLTEIEGLERIDLQLIAMIDDARERLSQKGINVEDKVIMMGFSASGYFTNRFAMLHPERVHAAAIGGSGGWDTIPLKEWNGTKLRYPVGVWDLESLIGKEFDLETWKTIPLYIYSGDQDLDPAADPVLWVGEGGLYAPEDRDLVLQYFGNNMTRRWQIIEDMFKSVGSQARFILYPGVGHEMTDEMLNDVKTFFSEQMARSSD